MKSIQLFLMKRRFCLKNENSVVQFLSSHILNLVKIKTKSSKKSHQQSVLHAFIIDNPTITNKGEKTFNTKKGYHMGKEGRFSNRIKTEIPGPGTYQ